MLVVKIIIIMILLIRYVGEAAVSSSEADQTIEILMSDLDPAVMAIFHRHLLITNIIITFISRFKVLTQYNNQGAFQRWQRCDKGKITPVSLTK